MLKHKAEKLFHHSHGHQFLSKSTPSITTTFLPHIHQQSKLSSKSSSLWNNSSSHKNNSLMMMENHSNSFLSSFMRQFHSSKLSSNSEEGNDRFNPSAHQASSSSSQSKSHPLLDKIPTALLLFLLGTLSNATIMFLSKEEDEEEVEHSSHHRNGIIVHVHAEESHSEMIKNDEEPNVLKYFTLEQVAQHDGSSKQAGSIWVIFKGGVYDVTEFIEAHPGGTEKIMLAAGKSIEPFWNIYRQHHTKEVYEILEQYKIGELDPKDVQKLNELKAAQENANDIYANDPKNRNPVLQVNMDKPFNAETPPSILVDKFITPNEVFFIRNHLPVPTLHADTYVLEILGEGIESPIKLTLNDLKNNDKLKHHTLTVALQCAGNRRTEMSCHKPPRGLGWTNAAVGNAQWTGVKLVDVLQLYGITEEKILNEGKVKHVEFKGADTDGISSYAISIPVDRAMSDKADVLLAFKMNGEDIPIDHGYPVRAIVPGAIGARNVKTECQSVWQQKDYKTFAPSVDWDTADFSKASAVHDAPVQSSICSPSPNIPIKDDTVLVKGYALAGSGNGIERVDITTDHGKTWYSADLERDPLKYNRNYGWTLWRVEIPVTDEHRKTGEMNICSKAVDSAYNVQPEDVKSIWNIRGILNNTWHCVNYKVHRHDDER
ncbi:hypothetical protein C9374_004382 [Naegleria lovaniensis]|uniref:sulfite oxidase n=1 Tax=Naegleria lovaniensis TaxID=51637 RepID=A0AA88GQY3_NAELO|nr:uncharacterized protein C9374_004382 [Naegleria lovaniensis]KAG2383711.1 hypothetical protein C9374_004382 [Naegleria lovaniensis]